jgi:hypothetical protein
MIREIHQTSKEIAKIVSKEGYWYGLIYFIMFIAIFISISLGAIKNGIRSLR